MRAWALLGVCAAVLVGDEAGALMTFASRWVVAGGLVAVLTVPVLAVLLGLNNP